MDFTKASVKRWLGNNLEKGKRVYKQEQDRAHKEFVKKYPFAKVERFEFWVSIDDHADLSSPTQIVYVGKAPGDTKLYNLNGTYFKYGWDINSKVKEPQRGSLVRW